MHSTSLVIDLALVMGVAALTSPIARRLGQPTVLGYLVAGLVVGPYIPIPLFADHERVESLAELGVVLVMFAVGLELRLSKLVRVLPTAGLTGTVQVGFLVWCGFTLGRLLGWSTVEGLFLGTCIAISSTMVVTRALDNTVDREIRNHVLGILVVQDVLAIVLIAAMTGVARSGTVHAEEVTSDLLQLVGVLLAMIVIGLLVVPRLVRKVASLASDEVLVVVAVGVCFVLAAVADKLGYSVALGAFVSGVLVAESGFGYRVEQLAGSMRDVFAGIFFVSIGMTVNPIEAYHTLPLALGITVLIIIAQLMIVSITGLLSGMDLRRSVTAGFALGQIGEFAFILAAIGISAGIVRGDLQALLVTVAVLTAFTTPLGLRISARVVNIFERVLPTPLRRTLVFQKQWIARMRKQGCDTGGTGTIQRGVRALMWDAILVFLLSVVCARWMDSGVPFIVAHLQVDGSVARIIWFGGSLIVALPIMVVTVRTANVLTTAILKRTSYDSTSALPAQHWALRMFVFLGLTALVLFPAATVIGVSIADNRGIILVVAALVVLTIAAVRSARDVDAEVRSVVQRIVTALTIQTWDGSMKGLSNVADNSMEPNHKRLECVTLTATSSACGRTLADVDLRVQTGATVVAIHSVSEPAALPNGKALLHESDVLVLTGTTDALKRARCLLVEGAIFKPEGPDSSNRNEPKPETRC